MTDEDALLQSVRRGDPNAWDRLYETNYQLVRRVITHVSRLGPAEVDDLAQETWVRTYEKLSSCKSAFKPWLLRIAYTITIDAIRRGQRLKTESIDEDPESVELVDESSGNFANAYEARELVSVAFERLEPDQRAILYLLDGVDFTQAEAAEVMGLEVSSAAMSQRLNRARAALRKAVRDLRLKARP